MRCNRFSLYGVLLTLGAPRCLTARNFETKTTVKCGAILENEDGSEFILLNHLLNYNDFVDHKRVANGHIKINIIAKEDWNE